MYPRGILDVTSSQNLPFRDREVYKSERKEQDEEEQEEKAPASSLLVLHRDFLYLGVKRAWQARGKESS